MNNIVIVSYDCDELGDYFKLCNIDLQQYISDNHIEIDVHCEHDNCNRENLHSKLIEFTDNYIISIYAHGENNRIKNNKKEDLINMDDAKSHYHNAIVYSTSCFTANELGVEMHNYGCKFFFGYKAKSYLSLNHKSDFIEMDNYTLRLILDEKTIDGRVLYEKTDKYFIAKLNELRVINPLLAPLIMHNRESFVIYHNRKEYPS